ncbi:hypothetical protein CRYUN_Cryun19dG0101500 [Craigia yunnanensis]
MFTASRLVIRLEWELMSTHAEIVSIEMRALKFIVQRGRFSLLMVFRSYLPHETCKRGASPIRILLPISPLQFGAVIHIILELDNLWCSINRYCFRIPSNYPLASAAPLLCAGITVYSPMMCHNMNQPGKSLGVIGLGGLGHKAVKFGKAFGLCATLFSTSISKKEEALNLLGADKFVVSSDQEQLKGLSKSLDIIVDTASGDHPSDPYMSLLKIAGVYVLVGFPSEFKFSPASLNLGMRTVSGSITGGTSNSRNDRLLRCS